MAAFEFKETPVEELPKLRDELKGTFRAGTTRPLEYRRKQLLQLARMIQDNADLFLQALREDLNKPRFEALQADIGPVVQRAIISANSLEEWSAPLHPAVPEFQKAWNATIYKGPVGVVLIISPWNYPVILSFQALIGAMAAGCPAVVKPSEFVPKTSALMAHLFPKYLDSAAYRVVNGAVKETTALLDMQWDYIFYTGNGRIGRIIATAAAKHLTPVALELGGKSPVIVDDNTDLATAAKRILHGKTTNAGQICISPDYVLVPRHRQDELIEALQATLKTFYAEGALESVNDDHYSRIVSPAHHQRLKKLLQETKGNIVAGGKSDEKKGLEPTIIRDVKGDDVLMEDELFGPVLPIVPVQDFDEAVRFVTDRPHPLAFYVFTDNDANKQKVINGTMSGSLVFNDTFMQLAVNELPFSGVGPSGHGAQVLKYTYDLFTHERSSIDIPAAAEPFFANVRYPPYSSDAEKIVASAHLEKIPAA